MVAWWMDVLAFLFGVVTGFLNPFLGVFVFVFSVQNGVGELDIAFAYGYVVSSTIVWNDVVGDIEEIRKKLEKLKEEVIE